MKDIIIKEIEQSLLRYLDNAQMQILHDTLVHCLDGVDIKESNEYINEVCKYSNNDLIERFISSKVIEGCSQRRIKYYQSTLVKMNSMVDIHFTHITTDDLRDYLAKYQKINNCSKASIDNIRRNLSSFFSWLEEENYILKIR